MTLTVGDDASAAVPPRLLAAAPASVDPPPATTQAEITVRVLWRDDDTPVTGLALAVTNAVRAYPVRASPTVRTDGEGRAVLHVPPGDHVVFASMECCKPITVRAGVAQEHVLHLPRNATLTGRFVAEDIPPGDGGAAAAAVGFDWAGEPFVAELGQVCELRIVLRRGPRILGRVLDPSGHPVEGARVLRGRRDALAR